MKRASFVAVISYYWQQQLCKWLKHLWPLGLGLVFSVSIFCAYRFYQLQVVKQSVQHLELGLVNFDQVVRAKNDLALEQSRLRTQLALLRSQDHARIVTALLQDLTAIAHIIPTKLYLTNLEVLPGQQLIVSGISRKAELVVQFWQKLLSLDQVLDGKIETDQTQIASEKSPSQQQFKIKLKVKALINEQDQTAISRRSV